MESLAKDCERRLRLSGFAVLAVLLAFMNSCADRPAPGATGPRSNEPPYPVLMTDAADRRETALVAWTKFIHEQGLNDAPAPELQPVTATIRSLPDSTGTPLYLPKVGDHNTMTEEETRESLRRFITSARAVLGAEPQQLSLVQRTDLADGTKKARYEQRPFRYPLRGDYGVVEITFAPDRRVLQMTSTAIPEVEQLQRAGAGVRPRWTQEGLLKLLVGRSFTYTDAAGNKQSFTIAKPEEIEVRELVVYPIPRATDPSVLEFRLVWEIGVGGKANQQTVYLDAVTDEILAVKQSST
ncbi:MAG TPA: hypothetical protein VF791_09060 [Pyrinomonadaceae bacterium]